MRHGRVINVFQTHDRGHFVAYLRVKNFKRIIQVRSRTPLLSVTVPFLNKSFDELFYRFAWALYAQV